MRCTHQSVGSGYALQAAYVALPNGQMSAFNVAFESSW
jgi:hypothetical protein